MRRAAALVLLLTAVLPAAAARADYPATVRATAGLVSYWPLDEGAGPTITDVIGHRAASLSPSAAFGLPPGIDGGGTAVSLTAATSASFGNVDNFSGDFTIEAWVAQSDASGDQYVVSKGTGTSGYQLMLLGGRIPAFQVNGTRITAPALSAGGWHQIVATMSSRTLTIYVDGQAAASGTTSRATLTSTQALTVGRSSRTAGFYYQGGLDELSMYSRALDAATVGAHFTAGSDTSAPHTVLTATPPAASDTPDGSFAFTGSKGGLTFRCSLDGAAATWCLGSYAYDLLRDGTHTLTVTATDRWGNVESPATSYSWTIALAPAELAPPQTLLTATPNALASTAAAQFAFSGSKSGLTWACRLDNRTWGACTSPASYPALAEGPHTFDARAIDRWGVVESSPAHFAWTVDLLPPSLALTSTPPAVSDTPDGSFAIAGIGNGLQANCVLDGTAPASCSSKFAFDLLRSGTHTLTVSATDRVGVAAAPVTYTWTVALPANEVAPPATTISDGPPALATTNAAKFTLTGSKTKLTWTCRLDGGAWRSCVSGTSLSNLPDGTHTFEARATDRWGVVEDPPARWVWTIDRTAPETFVLATKALAGDAGVALLGSEAGASFECRIGTGDWSPCAASTPLPAVAAPTPMAVRAIDAAGNVDASPATIELDPPDPVAPVLFTGASRSFVIGGNRSIAELQCSVDGRAAASCPWPLDFTGLGYGPHTLTISDPKLGGVVFPTVAWTSPLPIPLLAGSQFPALLSLGTPGAQARIAKARLPRILFQSNAAGSATVRLLRGTRTVAHWSARVIQGSNLVRLPRSAYRKIRPGRYGLEVAVTNASGTSKPLRLRFDAARVAR
jgi:hypothetical protein